MGRVYLLDSGAKSDKFNNRIVEDLKKEFCLESKSKSKSKTSKLQFNKNQHTDLTHLLTFTIDNKNTSSHDDAISIEKIDKTCNEKLQGHSIYKVYIHISDVSYFVKESKKNK